MSSFCLINWIFVIQSQLSRNSYGYISILDIIVNDPDIVNVNEVSDIFKKKAECIDGRVEGGKMEGLKGGKIEGLREGRWRG